MSERFLKLQAKHIHAQAVIAAENMEKLVASFMGGNSDPQVGFLLGDTRARIASILYAAQEGSPVESKPTTETPRT